MPEATAPQARRLSSPRAAALAGVLFAVLFTTALALLRSALPETLTSDADWLDADTSVRVGIGLSLVPFAGIAFLWFMGVVRDRFKDAEDQLFSSVFIGSGLLFLAMLLPGKVLLCNHCPHLRSDGDGAECADDTGDNDPERPERH